MNLCQMENQVYLRYFGIFSVCFFSIRSNHLIKPNREKLLVERSQNTVLRAELKVLDFILFAVVMEF